MKTASLIAAAAIALCGLTAPAHAELLTKEMDDLASELVITASVYEGCGSILTDAERIAFVAGTAANLRKHSVSAEEVGANIPQWKQDHPDDAKRWADVLSGRDLRWCRIAKNAANGSIARALKQQ